MEQSNRKAYVLLDNFFKSRYRSVNLTKNYSIIDKWMLSKRWEEEIIQTRREMIAFVTYFQDLHAKLTEDLAVQGIIVQSYKSGKKSWTNSGKTTPSWL
ncbi:Nfrkb-like protein [Daphnia magna]|uniref:Nfrkb-like protein n=1 Tax=Daphnia magna TaxID=35525 RepID=A0A164GE59_9CRUS|nr:Nfrkb-like protein [Daphnia magna]